MRPWARFALRRAVVLVVSLWVLCTATFFAIHLVPGDPARSGLSPTAPPEQVEARRQALNLDDSVPEQYWRFLRGAVTLDFGTSITTAEPVGDIIGARFPATARLALIAFAVTLLVAVPAGMLIAIATQRESRRALNRGFSVVTGTLISVPDYLLATGLVALFAVTLEWLPVAGDRTASAYVLPVAALAALPIAALARSARVETVKVLDQDYMRVARSKRLPKRVLYARHALPNALTATLTMCGLLLGALVAATVVVENIFAWPGLGSAVVQAVVEKDYPLAQGIVLVLGAIALIANLVVDVVLALIDPSSAIRET